MGRVVGALIGGLFFIWIADTRALNPGEIGWLMRYDWPIHFFGWHFFRREPWHWPPGLISSYYAPLGTSIGFTDSIPIVAFALKPFNDWLPATFQYIGAWLLICFTLQGLFAAWLASRWSGRVSVQACAAALFVMIPALLIRIGHPALCSHWLLLWALVVASRDGTARTRPLEWSAIGLVAGLLHPYLAVMVLTLLVAVVARSSPVPLPARARSLAAAIVAAVGGWWAAGLFSVSEAESLSTEGLGHYSMNLLAPITQTGWSQLLPDLPRATTGQDFEGFQYLGLGVLLLLAVAAWLSAFRRQVAGPGASRGASWHGFGATVFVAALAMAVFALSPRITFANHLVVDLGGPWTGRFAVFRATGRFFWPLAYLLLAWGIATICTRIPPRLTVTILMIAAAIQAIDLHAAHESRRRGARDPGFYVWETPMPSAVWHRILPHYQHLVLYPPPQCATQPVGYEAPAYLAGLHGLTINAGGVARPDEIARRRYCHDLGEQMKAGDLQDDAIFIVPPEEVRAIRTVARRPAVCGAIDRVSVCVTAASYQRWRDLATLD